MKFFYFSFIFILSWSSYAGLTQYDVVGSDKIKIELKKVCEAMGVKEAPIVDILSMSELDCMGKKVSVLDFCSRDYKTDPKFIRAYAEKKEKMVICEKASRVHLKYECASKSEEKCLDSEIGCYDFKKTLAINLKVYHHSLIAQGTKKILSCIYHQEN